MARPLSGGGAKRSLLKDGCGEGGGGQVACHAVEEGRL